MTVNITTSCCDRRVGLTFTNYQLSCPAMGIPTDSLQDWDYYTGHVEHGRTFVVTFPRTVRKSTETKGATPPPERPAPPAGPVEQLRRGDFFLLPYNQFSGGPHVHFTLTAEMHATQRREVILQKGDVIIGPYPRSGCTWTEHMVSLLLANGRDDFLDPATKNTYNPREPDRPGKVLIDTLFHGQPADVDLCAPWGFVCGQAYPYTVDDVRGMNVHGVVKRVFKTHQPVAMSMKGVDGKGPPAPGAKYIMVVRDPKDVAVSLFRVNSLNLRDLGMQFTPYVKLFLEGKCYLSPWNDYYAEWLALAEEYPDQFLIYTYENALRNPRQVLASIAKFLDLDCSDQVLDLCVRFSSFTHMKERTKSADAEHIHVGKAGGWRDWMSKEMVQAFNDLLDDDRLGKYGKMYQVNVDEL